MQQTNRRNGLGAQRALILTTALVLLASLFIVGGAQVAGAAPCTKLYTSSITNATSPWTAGTSGGFTLSFTNVSQNCTNVDIGSIRISIPSGWSVTGVGFTGKTWTVDSSLPATGVLNIRASDGTQKVSLNQTLEVNITATAPCAAGTFSWDSTVWPSTDYGATSPSTFARKSGNPVPSVTTTAGSFATKLVITSVAPQTGTVLVGGEPFDVKVQAENDSDVAAPVCSDTLVTLSKSVGKGTLSGTLSGTISAGSSDPITIAGVTYTFDASTPYGENGVVICASATGLTQGCKTVNFAKFAATVNSDTDTTVQLGGTTGSSGALAASTTSSTNTCDTDKTNFTCVVADFTNGTGDTDTTVALGTCDGITTGCHGLLLTLISSDPAAFDQAYSLANPYVVSIECDKTACQGGGVSSYKVYIDLTNTGTNFVQSPACLSNDKTGIDPSLGTPFCTDYESSHRDGASDLILFVRLAVDALGKH